MYKRTVWREAHDGDFGTFVPRCARCGRYKSQGAKLMVHWFFRGLYCESCIIDILYDNARSVREINGESVSL